MTARRRHNRPKTKTLILHSRSRARTRFGLELSDQDIKDMVEMIHSGTGKFVEKQSHRVSVWDLEFKGHTIRVVYDKLRMIPITFLWPEGDVFSRLQLLKEQENQGNLQPNEVVEND